MINENFNDIQNNDHAIGDLKRKVEQGSGEWKEPHLKQYKKHRTSLCIDSNILFKIHNNSKLIVIPFGLMADIATKTHEQLSHIGSDKLKDILLKQFWHPALETICRDICKCCIKCQFHKVHRHHIKPPTLKIETSYPFELLAIDVMVLPRTPKGNIGVVVAIDHHSKWLTAIPIRNKTAATVTNALKNNILPNLPRVPTKILSDNGPEFRSGEFNKFLNEYSIQHIYSTPYKPSSNGCVERSNRTIIQLLKGSIQDQGHNWDSSLSKALITYNSTVHSEIKTSPSNFILNHSHQSEPSLPISEATIKTWRVGNPKFSPFRVGQKVLKKVQRSGNLVGDKLKARYEGPFEIMKTNPNDVTYEIKRLGECNSKTIKAHFEQLKEFIEIPEYLKKHVEFEEYKVRGGNVDARILESPTIPNLTLWDTDTTSDSDSDSESENGQLSATNINQQMVSETKAIKTKSEPIETPSVNQRDQQVDNQAENLYRTDFLNSLDEFLQMFNRVQRKVGFAEELDLSKFHCTQEIDFELEKDPRGLLTSTPIDGIQPSFLYNPDLTSIQLETSNNTIDCDSTRISTQTPSAGPSLNQSVGILDIYNQHYQSMLSEISINKSHMDLKQLAFVNQMNTAWTMSSRMIEAEISRIDQEVNEISNMPQSEDSSKSEEGFSGFQSTEKSNGDKSFVGFGQATPNDQVGSAISNFIKAIKRHSERHKNLSEEYKESLEKSTRATAALEKRMSPSVFRLCPSISFSDSEITTETDKRKRQSTECPRRIVTRSRGRPLPITHVQAKTLEYKSRRRTDAP